MCGLFGMLGGGIGSADLQLLTNLSYISAMRGTDATGVAFGSSYRRNGGDCEVVKVNGDPFYFDYMNKSKEYDNLSNNYYLGHTRSSTRGERGIRGAQPFEFDGLAGTHNGTIKSYTDKDIKGYFSDSGRLFADIEEYGVDQVIPNLRHDDAFALVWYDKKERKVNFLRNELRPLYFAVAKDKRVMYYYSEHAMLKALLERHCVKTTDIYTFAPGMLYSFDPGKLLNNKIGENFTVREIGLPEDPVKKTAEIVHIGGKNNKQQQQKTDIQDIPWMNAAAAKSLN